MAKTTADPTDLVFRALASQPRREIMRMLAAAPDEGADANCGSVAHDVCACRFSAELGLSAATVSHHMSVLREAGLVTGSRDGLWVYYRIRPEAIAEVLGAVTALYPLATTRDTLISREGARP